MVFTGCFGQLVIWFLVIHDEMKRALIPELDLKAMYHWHLLTDHIDLFLTSNFQMDFSILVHGVFFSANFDLPILRLLTFDISFFKTYYDLPTK